MNEAVELGLVFDCPMDDSYAARWDMRPIQEETDLGWIGEDADGVWLKVHPHAAFLAHPELWEPVTRFQLGDQELRPEDYEKLSAFDIECKIVMVQALNRKYQPEQEQDDE